MFARPGEAIAGRGLYERSALKVGDTLTVRVAGKPITLTLVGRHVEPDNDGRGADLPGRRSPESRGRAP